jgi:hypothetical protein
LIFCVLRFANVTRDDANFTAANTINHNLGDNFLGDSVT